MDTSVVVVSPQKKRGTRESSQAVWAFEQYLGLPPPRDLKKLVGSRAKGKNGVLGKPLSLHMLQNWRTRYRWIARAQEHDDRVRQQVEDELLSWQVAEHVRRTKLRLQAAELQRIMAVRELTYPEDHEDPQKRGRPKSMDDIHPAYLDMADKFLMHSANTERLDLGQATERIEAAPTAGRVVTEEQMEELRRLVGSLPKIDPQLVIEGHVLPDGTIPGKVKQLARQKAKEQAQEAS